MTWLAKRVHQWAKDTNNLPSKRFERDGMVYFGRGGYTPIDLHRRGSRIRKFYRVAAYSPAIVLLLGMAMPTSVLLPMAQFFIGAVWRHLKTVSVDGCASSCHAVAYGLVGIPVSWLMLLIAVAIAIPLSAQNWAAGQEALRRGAAPYGATAMGQPRPAPSLVLAFCLGGLGSVALCAALAGVLWILFALAGVSHIATAGGRAIPTALISVIATMFMGIAQFLAVVIASGLTFLTLRLKQSLVAASSILDESLPRDRHR